MDAQERVFDLVPPPQQGPQPGEQFVELKRLREIIVRPEVEARDFVVRGVSGGQHEDMGFDAVFTPFLEKRQAVDLGKHDVENDDIVRRARAL